MWDETNQETVLGKCTAKVPSGPNYDQRMITEWFDLTTAKGESGGRIRLGIRYIYDQVKLFDSVLERRSEEQKLLLKELEDTQTVLDQTSSPFEVLINPDKNILERDKNGAISPLDNAFDKLTTVLSGRVGSAENYVVDKISGLPQPGMRWGNIAQIGSGVYAILALIVAFTNEDFINVFFSVL